MRQEPIRGGCQRGYPGLFPSSKTRIMTRGFRRDHSIRRNSPKGECKNGSPSEEFSSAISSQNGLPGEFLEGPIQNENKEF